MPTTGRILIVADDADQRELFILALERAGYAVVAVHDAETALQLIERESFALVLTDYMLPRMFGDELIRLIHQRRYPLKTILMSNHIDARLIARASQADACFCKTDLYELLHAIATLLHTAPEYRVE